MQPQLRRSHHPTQTPLRSSLPDAAAQLQQAHHPDHNIDCHHTDDEPKLNPLLEAGHNHCGRQEDEDEDVVELRPQLGEEAGLLRGRQGVGAVAAAGGAQWQRRG